MKQMNQMNKQCLRAIRQVLEEAAYAPNFFDLSDAERLNWMIARAFTLGMQHEIKLNGKKGVPNHEQRKQHRVA